MINIFLELLEVSIHSILFYRQLYPESIFVLKKKYGVPVHVSRYPDLNYYIEESLKYVRELIISKELQHISLCFYEGTKVIERYNFGVIKLPEFCSETGMESDPYLIHLEHTLRAFLLKLSIARESLKALPDGATFKILIRTTESAAASCYQNSKFDDFKWIEVEDSEFNIEDGLLLPLRSIAMDNVFHMETFVESVLA